MQNSGEESLTDWILDFDFNPERVVHLFTFQTQHGLSSGEKETSVDEEGLIGKPVSSRNVDSLSRLRRGKCWWCSCDNCQEKYT